jgi:hypothetical protein
MLDFIIAFALVSFVSFQRFAVIPPVSRARPENLPGLMGTIRNWFSVKIEPDKLFKPARANTTRCKFLLFRVLYVAIAIFSFYSLLKLTSIQKLFEILLSPQLSPQLLGVAGPTFAAVLFIIAFSYAPPFRGADDSLRRILYKNANIPAQQLAEQYRLKTAPFTPNADSLEAVRLRLIAEGFENDDLIYQATPTARSMWIKVAVLCFHVEENLANVKLGTELINLANEILENFRSQKHNAKACFASLRNAPDTKQTEQLNTNLRNACYQLLDNLYELNSRITLIAHGSDLDRVKAARRTGFLIIPFSQILVPEFNDLVWFAFLLLIAMFLPLWFFKKFIEALGISAIVYISILTPIFLLAVKPTLVEHKKTGSYISEEIAFDLPLIIFPVVSAFLVGFLTFFIGIAVFGEGDFFNRLNHYIHFQYPYTSIPVLYSLLTAFRIQVPYDKSKKHIYRGSYVHGNVKDAIIFSVSVTIVYTAAVLSVKSLRSPDLSLVEILRNLDSQRYLRIGLNTMAAGLVGFFVPCWYRVNKMRAQRAQEQISIRFVFPNQFRGAFALVEDPKNGVNVDSKGKWLELSVPQSRKIFVNNIGSIDEYQIADAKDELGNHIKIEYLDESSDTQIMLRDCGYFNDNARIFVVGQRCDAIKSYKEKSTKSLEEIFAC